MRTAERIDAVESELAAAGEVYFHIAGRGHEAAAAFGLSMGPQDWLHPHYRDKALMTLRGLTPEDWLNAAVANDASYSHGRQMADFMASRELHLCSTVIPVGNHALQAVGLAQQVRSAEGDPVVYCGLGDGTTQQGEVLEAIAEAVRDPVPLLVVIQDNTLAISTNTAGQTFFDLPSGPADAFMGLPIHRFDGKHVLHELDRIDQLVDQVRQTRGPAIALMRCERVFNHSNADDQRVYRDAGVLETLADDSCPVKWLREDLIQAGVDAAELDRIDREADQAVRSAADQAVKAGDPEPCLDAKPALPKELTHDAEEQHPAAPRDAEAQGEATKPMTMLEAMRGVLHAALDQDPRVEVTGQDIEDPKGDVFGLTKGLSTAFPGRVTNAALSESTIVGTAIGRAMAGGRPVAMIQFADFLPNGINQVLSEMGTMYWRTGGQFTVPMVLMVTCGGYRPGLGPFHSQTHESILAHTPGLDVVMPSCAADAAGLLHAALKSGRPTVMLYPKTALNDRHPEAVTAGQPEAHLVPLGQARTVREGRDLTLIAWGSTVPVARDVADTIAEQTSQTCHVLDLRSLSPWDKQAVIDSAKRTGRLLVLHEDTHTAGFGAEVVATVTEASDQAIRSARVARPDVPVPYNFPNQLEILPGYRRTLKAAAELLDLELSWASTDEGDATLRTIDAPAPSPADQAVTVAAWHVKVGEAVKAGQPLFDVEADKAAHEVASPSDGVIEEFLVDEGVEVPVGEAILRLRVADAGADAQTVKRTAREDRGQPVLHAQQAKASPAHATASGHGHTVAVHAYLSPIHLAEGRDRLTNADLVAQFPDRTETDIVKRTGIESRPVLAADQSALSIATEAAEKALQAEGLTVHDLTGIVCHTTTPTTNTPSMACLILAELNPEADAACMVYDVNAACSGWLYALDTAYHTVMSKPDSKVLVVTTEALTRVVDESDFDTAILFGDAATATVMRGHRGDLADLASSRPANQPTLVLHPPELSGKADPKGVLTVGFEGHGVITMDGRRVYTEAVRAMTHMVRQAFENSGKPIDSIDWLVPHQANRRIFESVRERLSVPADKVIDMIAQHGNTSSSSIPLSMAKSDAKFLPGQSIGVCAFGGGFTFGAAILDVV